MASYQGSWRRNGVPSLINGWLVRYLWLWNCKQTGAESNIYTPSLTNCLSKPFILYSRSSSIHRHISFIVMNIILNFYPRMSQICHWLFTHSASVPKVVRLLTATRWYRQGRALAVAVRLYPWRSYVRMTPTITSSNMIGHCIFVGQSEATVKWQTLAHTFCCIFYSWVFFSVLLFSVNSQCANALIGLRRGK